LNGLDSRLRGNDGKRKDIPPLFPVIPAEAGIQVTNRKVWIPAFAGMTGKKGMELNLTDKIGKMGL